MKLNTSICASLIALSVTLIGCAGKPSGSGIQVWVVFDANVQSRCVKVLATDEVASYETPPIGLEGESSPLHVVVVQKSSVGKFIDLQAVGFVDTGCTQLSPGEASEVVHAQLSQPPRTVTLTLRSAGIDGGIDGGSDGGHDAGVDLDSDTYSVPDDCNDSDPNIHPAATETCANGLDDNCDRLTDCQEAACAGQQCAGGGTCNAGMCQGPTELSCSDGVDNDGDGTIDCADPDCPMGSGCNDLNVCTVGDRCSATGTCEKAADLECIQKEAVSCYESVGMCAAGADGGCFYQPSPSNSLCNDGLNCTVNDHCDGDGGCVGTQVTCAPADQCQQWMNTCELGGQCIFETRVGQTCDTGTAPGTCTIDGRCQSVPSGPFPYTPSNFNVAELPQTTGAKLVVNCDATIDTDFLSGGCLGTLPMALITPPGGGETVLLAVDGLEIQPNRILTIEGSRPLIIAVKGSATLNGTIRAKNGAGNASACGAGGSGNFAGGSWSGGGGGGFGNAGAPGGTSNGVTAGAGGIENGNRTLIPIRGGCSGGDGADNSSGGLGGGAVQISATHDITIGGIISAPGGGGLGGVSDGASGGGGGSGGAVLLEARTISLKSSGRVTANGGGGGEGHYSVVARSGDPGDEDGSQPASGGSGGAPAGGDGGNGAAGTISATSGGDGARIDFFEWAGGGGGGGGVGRIRFNASSSCDVTASSVVSPQATSNGAPGCTP